MGNMGSLPEEYRGPALVSFGEYGWTGVVIVGYDPEKDEFELGEICDCGILNPSLRRVGRQWVDSGSDPWKNQRKRSLPAGWPPVAHSPR